ncbi:MAG: hypothetical protein BGO43_14960 [Gammaproteobacteria bacterium 39-13]|nr:multidrug effflux MFS transporter [Gammaproteobacteria bacterium]OJV86238.1 MAG: hypothetical protein BGO43_14960 [Gammaproteobacteria bacterium 39-13]
MSSIFKSKIQEVLFLSISLLAFITFYIETDIYTPSFPEMVAYFGTNEESIQQLLSMNFLGLCLSSLLFGPASDAYGRKPMLFIGLFIFMVSSIGCAMTESLEYMIYCRFIQGLGCGAITSAGLASIFDVYPPEKSARLVSILNGTVGGLMALAPIIGAWISIHFGWRANFYLIAFLATLTYVCNAFFTQETLPKEKRHRLTPTTIFKNYLNLLSNFPFMAHSLIWCLMFSIVIVFIANLSLIFIDYLAVPLEDFGFYQMAIMGAFFGGSMSAAYTIKKCGMLFTKVIGSFLYIISITCLGMLSYFNINSPIALILAMSLASFGVALSLTIYFSYSMTHVDDSLKGSAMALTQSLRLFLTSGLVWLAAIGFDGSTKPMSVIAASCTLISVLLYVMLYAKKLHYVSIAV